MYNANPFDVLAVDEHMPVYSGLNVIRQLASTNRLPPTIMITGSGDERTAVEALKLGAMDYIVKDINGGYLDLIPSVITQILSHRQLVEEQQRSQETLRQSEERYRSLVEMSPDGIAVLINEQFLFVNKATVYLFAAQDADELLGRSIAELFHARDRNVLQAAMTQVQRTHEPAACLEMQAVTFDDQIVHCEMMLASVTFNGQPAVQIIIRNITERVQAEQLRRESEGLRIALEKEQELGELKMNLMMTLSHELRTPLTIIQSSTEFLDRFFHRLSDEQRQVRLHNIQSQVKKLTALAEDINILIRGTLDHLTPKFDFIDLEELCRGVVEEMHFFSEERRNLRMTIEGNLRHVFVDPYLVNRIITNLLSNGIKYSPESGEVLLSVRQDPDSIVIQVSDTGIGIPEDDKEHLFEIFHRGNNVGYINGIGLGLAIVQEAITAHNGTITCESTEGVGTTFTVRLPLLAPGNTLEGTKTFSVGRKG
jgi:PAS domain S-box-containing protein